MQSVGLARCLIGLIALLGCSSDQSPAAATPSNPVEPKTLPPLVSISSGDAQSGAPGTKLPNLLAVKVTNSSGQPLAGVGVTFQVSSNGGTVDPVTDVTEMNGIAYTSVTLPVTFGTVTVSATASVLQNAPVVFSLSSRLVFHSLRAGGTSTCAGTTSGSLCWGDNGSGQLGDGTTSQRNSPTAVIVPSGIPFSQFALSTSSSCALIGSGHPYCWGSNSSGNLGDGTTTQQLVPVSVQTPGASRYTVVATGAHHACALIMGADAIYCWGDNSSGAIGDGTQTTRLTPTRVSIAVLVNDISAGNSHTCAISFTSTAYCWGSSQYGQTGTGLSTSVARPTTVGTQNIPALLFSSVTAGGDHTCAFTTARDLYCWGRNDAGQVGDGGTINQGSPVKVNVPTGVTFISVALGNKHTCGIATTRQLYCWGNNDSGQLGDGTTVNRSTPMLVANPSALQFKSVTAGSNHTCALADDVAYCWGWNLWGQLGDGTNEQRLVPTRVKSQ